MHSAAVRPGDGGRGVRVALDAGGTAHALEASHLLAAVGRRPNTDDLGLDAAGIALDARGYITVDEELRTNVPGRLGARRRQRPRRLHAHVVQRPPDRRRQPAARRDAPRVSDRIPAYALFIDPPLGRVGMSEAEVRARGRPALVGTMPMTRVGRARERGETQGFMKVLVDAESERILGASLLCIEGDEIVHSLLDVMAADASYKVDRSARCTSIRR